MCAGGKSCRYGNRRGCADCTDRCAARIVIGRILPKLIINRIYNTPCFGCGDITCYCSLRKSAAACWGCKCYSVKVAGAVYGEVSVYRDCNCAYRAGNTLSIYPCAYAVAVSMAFGRSVGRYSCGTVFLLKRKHQRTNQEHQLKEGKQRKILRLPKGTQTYRQFLTRSIYA